jgi:hypothetical protein
VEDEIARLGRLACRPARLYPVRTTAAYGHHAGRLPDGRQALVTCGYPKQVCVYLFAPEGDYIGVERRTPRLEADLDDTDGHVSELYAYLSEAFGFVPGLICVKRFSEPSEIVSIEPLPDALAELVADPESVDAEERAGLLEWLRRWVEEGSFLLNTWNEYWLDDEGRVTSS